MSMNVVGLRLYVLSYATHSLSDDPPPFLLHLLLLPLVFPLLPNCKLFRNSIMTSSNL